MVICRVEQASLLKLWKAARMGESWNSRLFIAWMFSKRYGLKGMRRLLDPYVSLPRKGNLINFEIRVLDRSYQIYMDPYDGGDRPSFFEVFYELNPALFPENPPTLIIDAGAHVGFFTLLAAAKYSSSVIHAFEPYPRNVRLLRKHIEDNSINAFIHEAALWRERGQVNLVGSKSNNAHIQGLRQDINCVGETHTVECVRLSETVPEIKKGRLLLKMDIEGAELEVLKADLPLIGKSSTVLLELHDTEANLTRLLTLVEKCKWSLKLLKYTGSHSYWILNN